MASFSCVPGHRNDKAGGQVDLGQVLVVDGIGVVAHQSGRASEAAV